jgi:TonB family protein
MKRLLLACSSLFLVSLVSAGDLPPYAYHLRVVRVSPANAVPGAALGWAPDGGEPVIVPSDEAWGTPEQLEALAETLEGNRAEAVTGFWVPSGPDGILRFERKVYVGPTVLELSFEALPPNARVGSHEVSLVLSRLSDAGPPLAEARVRIATDRTVALAAPGERAGDWVVLAVTPLEPGEIDERYRQPEKGREPPDAAVEMPRLLSRVDPEYPEGARSERLSGKIVMQVLIDRTGIPRAPMILEMTPGTEELAGAAVDAVQQWRYAPATRGGEPVAVWFTIVVAFRLE